MTMRGYSRYRGGQNKKKTGLVIGLVVILLAAIGLLICQNYLAYDDTGKMHWEFPFMQREDAENKEPVVDPNDVKIDRQEPAFVVGKDLTPMQAQELPLWCLNDDPTWLLEGAPQYVVVNVKATDGALAYASKVSVPDGVAKGGDATLTNLRTILDSKHQAVARLSCLCDNSYAYAMPQQAALCQEDGSIWWDSNGRYWLDPAKEETLHYVEALCQECVTLGFDEIMLDYFGYPAQWEGKADRTAVLHQFITALREALPEGTRISVLLHELPTAQDGLTAQGLSTDFDRLYLDSGVESKALQQMMSEDFDAATRLVPIVWEPADNGSYMITAD